MNNVLAHLRDNIGPARDGDPEGIHQLHIATRRTRSALRMFKTQLLPMVVQQFDKELRDSALIFGKARDWQLFVTETLDAVPNAEAIGKCAVQQQTLAFHNAKRLLADPRFEGILDRMTDWIDEVSIPSTIETLTPDLLDRLAKRVIRRRRRAVISDENSLHRLRKSAKDLRYGVEFVSSLYRNSGARGYLSEIKDAWDILGSMHDAVVTRTLAKQLTTIDEQTEKWLYLHQQRAMRCIPEAINDLRLNAFW